MINTLKIKLNDSLVGYLTHYQDGKNVFTFDDSYIQAENKPILSLSFTDLSQSYVSRYRLPSFFSNLLPEGDLRQLICSQLNIHSDNEFELLCALGHDLPGAVIAEMDSASNKLAGDFVSAVEEGSDRDDSKIHFSLAGVQIKFSMLKEKSWFTLAKNNLPGDTIIKTPSLIYPHVPENEYSMMQLAKAIGIDVPKTRLIPIAKLKDLPVINLPKEKQAYAIERFDREGSKRIHIEDFAQVFDVKPQGKYSATNYDSMAKFIYHNLPYGQQQLMEFIRRIIFTILIGNTDAHLKNWSLVYESPTLPKLAPAYDLVTTLPYLTNRDLALNFAKLKHFYQLDLETFKYFAHRIDAPAKLIIDTLRSTVTSFKLAWQRLEKDLPLPKPFKIALEQHWVRLPIMKFVD